MTAWTSPALMVRLTPLRICLPSTPAERFLISNIVLLIFLNSFFNHGWTRINTDKKSQYNAFKFQPGVFEIQNQADSQFRDLQIIQHLAALVVGDSINHF